GMERTITHRLLHSLRDEGIIEGTSDYTIGPRALTMSSAYLLNSRIHRVALPYLIDLLENTVAGRPWVVMLMIPVQDRIVIVDRIWGADAPLHSILAIGTSIDFAGSAGGRTILASLADEEVP